MNQSFVNKEIYLIHTIVTIIAGFEVTYQVKYFKNVNYRGIRRRPNHMLGQMTKFQLILGVQDEKLLSPFLEMF